MINKKMNNQESGFILVTCLVILVILSLVGTMATNTAISELKSSTNDRIAKSAFYRADSGIYTAPKVVRESIDDGPAMNLPNIQLIDPASGTPETSADFYDKIKGYIIVGGVTASTSIAFQQSTETTAVTIRRTGSEPLPGESAEFLSGYGGAGKAMAFATLYELQSTGTAQGDGVSRIDSLYKYIPRPGGL